MKEVSTFLTYYFLNAAIACAFNVITYAETIPELKNLLNEKNEKLEDTDLTEDVQTDLRNQISTVNASLVGWQTILDDYSAMNSRAFNEGLENAGRCHAFPPFPTSQ